MTEAGTTPEGAERVWSRRRWLTVTAALAAVQILAFWALSRAPKSETPTPARATSHAVRWAVPAHAGKNGADWRQLLSPGVLLLPSPEDFSGRGWLQPSAEDLQFEAFDAVLRPLPFEPVQALRGPSPVPRADAGLASRWALAESPVGIPPGSAPPVPLPEHGRVWILEGLAGWALAGTPEVKPPPGSAIPPPAVVRVVVDSRGELAMPPILWEGTGNPATDEAALQVATALSFRRAEEGGEGIARADLNWGMLGVRWPAGGPEPR